MDARTRSVYKWVGRDSASERAEPEGVVVPPAEPVVRQAAALHADAVDARVGAVLEVDDVVEAAVPVRVPPDVPREPGVQLRPQRLDRVAPRDRVDHEPQHGAHGEAGDVPAALLRDGYAEPALEHLAHHVAEAGPGGLGEGAGDRGGLRGVPAGAHAVQRQVEALRARRRAQLDLRLLYRRNDRLLELLRRHARLLRALRRRPGGRVHRIYSRL